MSALDVEIVPDHRGGAAIVHNGRVVRTCALGMAASVAYSEERKLRRRARNCMCCGTPFRARDVWIRLCDDCKERDGGLAW